MLEILGEIIDKFEHQNQILSSISNGVKALYENDSHKIITLTKEEWESKTDILPDMLYIVTYGNKSKLYLGSDLVGKRSY